MVSYDVPRCMLHCRSFRSFKASLTHFFLRDLVPAFLEFGNPSCYIDAPDFEGNTALHLACQKGYKQTAELLLNQGADVVDGETDAHFGRHSPLHLAAAYGHVDVVELLISHGAPVDCRDESQRTPLQR